MDGSRRRRPGATGAALAACAALALLGGCRVGDESGSKTTAEPDDGAKLFDAAAVCESSAAQVVFTPGRVEVRARGVTVAWADGEHRGLDDQACERVPSPKGNRVGVGYTWIKGKPAAIRCRLRSPGRFLLYVYPVYDPRSGERVDRPSGSSVSLLIGPRRFLVASSTIYRAMYRAETPSTLSFWPGRCTVP